jgi:hypothetical protein
MDINDDINKLIDMIDGKMNGGVSRLKVEFTEELQEGQRKEAYHHGRCDVGSPWATGTVGNCDAIDSASR